ncbi:MAG: YczE/YyaS/YitT family protein [Propionibacteriaceae bacterium]
MIWPLRSRRSFHLPSLTSRQQLTAGHLPQRLAQLFVGLFLYGFSMAMMIESTLGVMPWDVLHQGLSRYLPLSFGQIAIAVGAVVLLLWIPLRQWPGLGTVANVIVVGLVADLGLWLLPTPDGWAVRIALVVGGVVLNGLAGAVYIGSILGPGPRDGLMTGLHLRTGRSIRLVRTLIEVGVVAIGWLLGGTLGLGTVLYAIAIGPLTQLFLPLTANRHLTEPLISPPMK